MSFTDPRNAANFVCGEGDIPEGLPVKHETKGDGCVLMSFKEGASERIRKLRRSKKHLKSIGHNYTGHDCMGHNFIYHAYIGTRNNSRKQQSGYG